MLHLGMLAASASSFSQTKALNHLCTVKTSYSSTTGLNSHEDRREFLTHSAAMALGIGWMVSSSPARAAIPTMDDYESTTNGALLKQKKDSSVPELAIREMGLKQTTLQSKADLQSLGILTERSLDALKVIVGLADWAGVRSVLRGEGSNFEGNVLSILRKPYFGVKGGERVFLKILGNGESVSSLEDAREELSFSLAELEDFALENRSIFFNSLDRKQMDELIAESGFKENKSEGEKLLSVARQSAISFKEAVDKL